MLADNDLKVHICTAKRWMRISCATISRNLEPSNCQENIRFRLALPEMRRRESGRRTIMFGQKTIPDPHQEIVDQYLREHNPCEPSKPLRINLRKYLQYAEEHHITDPSTIPDEILDQFMVEPQRAAQ